MKILKYLSFSLLIFSSGLAAQDYHMLIDPDGHSGKVHELLFTPDNRLISLSEDKSIQVWDLSTQTMVDKFFAPLELGPEGMIYSAALDSKGRLLAYSGYILQDSVFAVVVMDLVTKKEIVMVQGHNSPISALEFSGDDLLLASGDLSGRVVIWNINGAEFSQKQTYQLDAGINDLAFDPSNQNIAIASESKHLYTVEFSRSDQIKRFEKHFYGISDVLFTPDGQHIITAGKDGYIHQFRSNGKHLRRIDKLPSAVTSLSISFDGAVLVAMTEGDGLGYSYKLPEGNRVVTFMEHDNTVTSSSISPVLSFGNYQVASAGGNNNQIMIWSATSGRLSSILNGDGMSIWKLAFADSTTLLIGNSQESNRYNTSFDFSSQNVLPIDQLAPVAEQKYLLLSPYKCRFENGGTIQNSPTIDGRILSVKSIDNSYLIGSDFSLKQYAQDGKLIREFVGHEAGVRALAVSPAGNILITGGEDQKIMGWSLVEGAGQSYPLFQLFLTRNGDWVMWSKDGYYSSSPQGARYLGWKTAKGFDAETSYFSVDQYFEVLYRPKAFTQAFKSGERVEQILEKGGERRFDLADLNKPSLAFFGKPYATQNDKSFYLSTKSFSQVYTSDVSPVTFETTLYDRGGGIKEFKVYHNDKLALIEKDISQNSERRIDKEFTMPLLNGLNKIEIVATNFQNIDSKPHQLNIEYTGETVALSDLYVFTIGINEYANPLYNLNYAFADAKAFTAAITKNASQIYNKVHTYEIFNSDATFENIQSGIQEIQEKAKLQDVFIFYYAGHGTIDESNNNDYYLVPSDITQLYGDSKQLITKGISAGKIKEWLANIKAQKQLILLDACHSGEAVQTFAARGISSEERAIVQLARSSGTVLISASGSKQFATEFEELKHGAFTYALLEALEGKADGGDRDAKITVNEIKSYMEDRVPELTRKFGSGNAQYPTGFSTGQDFPIKVLDK